MKFVDEAERHEDQAASHGQVVVDEKVQVGELDRDFVCVFDFDLRIEQEAIIESIADIDDVPKEIEPRGFRVRDATLVFPIEVLVEHLAVPGDRHAFGRAIDCRGRRCEAQGASPGVRQLLRRCFSAAQPLNFGREQLELALQFFDGRLLHVSHVRLGRGGRRGIRRFALLVGLGLR